jgi:hypothetical protein
MNASTHFDHPKFDREEIVSLGGCHLFDQQRTFLATYSNKNLSTSVSAHLMSEILTSNGCHSKESIAVMLLNHWQKH